MGFWQGGSAPFGMRRQIVNQNGEPKEILEFGQWKSVSTDRVVLAPGPPKDVEIIQLAFDLYTKQRRTRDEIAPILNQRKSFWGNTPWNILKLRRLFTNPIYKGAYPYCKTRLSRDLPPEKWLIREHSFPAIISEKQWNQARERVREEVKRPVDSEMLEGLRRLWKRKGTITSNLINAAKDIPSAPAYSKHFGGLNEAYKLIGFPIKHDCAYVHAINMTRKMREGVYDDICTQIRAAGGTAERTLAPERILINGNITAKVNLTTGHLFCSGHVRWVLLLGKQPLADIQIFARLEPPHRDILDYFVVPALSQLHGALRPKKENNAPFLDLYRFPTLEPLIKTLGRVPITRLA
jgi:Recombinase